MTDNQDELVPVDEVLNDMEHEDGMVAAAATDYFYMHYADDEQREQHYKAERGRERIFNVISFALAVAFAVWVYSKGM